MVTRSGYAAAIGNFDGVHRGHQFLLRETIQQAKEINADAGVVLFEPHPRRFFDPGAAPFLLTRSDLRDEYLRQAGAQKIIVLEFNKTLASLPPEKFITDVLAGKLKLRGVVAGKDFRFGAKRAGGVTLLQEMGEQLGLAVKVAELEFNQGASEKFGSSAARAAIRDGKMNTAAQILGRPWTVRGAVAPGEKRGRTIGFPTANMQLGDILEPKKGVYAVRVLVDGDRFGGVANFGRRPTVGSSAPLLETHIFDFNKEIYGREIDVSFTDFIRDEKKFSSLGTLSEQIEKDCRAARRLLSNDAPPA